MKRRLPTTMNRLVVSGVLATLVGATTAIPMVIATATKEPPWSTQTSTIKSPNVVTGTVREGRTLGNIAAIVPNGVRKPATRTYLLSQAGFSTVDVPTLVF